MVRWMPVLFGALLVTLVVFGIVADRALVGQEQAARGVAAAKADEIAQGVARTVRATIAQVEQSLVAGRAPEGVTSERLAIPRHSDLPLAAFIPYPKRPRESSSPPRSDGVTPSGLPEAVVARLDPRRCRSRFRRGAGAQGRRTDCFRGRSPCGPTICRSWRVVSASAATRESGASGTG